MRLESETRFGHATMIGQDCLCKKVTYPPSAKLDEVLLLLLLPVLVFIKCYEGSTYLMLLS